MARSRQMARGPNAVREARAQGRRELEAAAEENRGLRTELREARAETEGLRRQLAHVFPCRVPGCGFQFYSRDNRRYRRIDEMKHDEAAAAAPAAAEAAAAAPAAAEAAAAAPAAAEAAAPPNVIMERRAQTMAQNSIAAAEAYAEEREVQSPANRLDLAYPPADRLDLPVNKRYLNDDEVYLNDAEAYAEEREVHRGRHRGRVSRGARAPRRDSKREF